jgi:hypothetical protein
MKRGSFLKRLFGGVAAIVATPSILEAAKKEEGWVFDGTTGYMDTRIVPGSSSHVAYIDENQDVIHWQQFGDGESELHINGVRSQSHVINGKIYRSPTMENNSWEEVKIPDESFTVVDKMVDPFN